MTEEETDEYPDVEDLQVESIIAFNGDTVNACRIHPDGDHIIFPIGNKVSILNWWTKKQEFLAGHTNIISAIDLSANGKFIASGQINHIGFRASVIIWDYETRTQYCKHEIHKVRVEVVSFSTTARFLISLGGRDCGSVVVYDIEDKNPLCGATASPDSAGETTVLASTNRRDECFITGGYNTLRVWTIDDNARALQKMDVIMGKIKRNITSIAVDHRDEYAYCGTSTGDIIKVKLNYHSDAGILTPIKTPNMIGCFGKIDPRPKRNGESKVMCYSKGVRVIHLLFDGRFIIGAGDGEIDLVEVLRETQCPKEKCTPPICQPCLPRLSSQQKTRVGSSVSSIQMKDKNTIFVSTTQSEIFSINLNDFKDIKLLVTCHTSAIYDIVFPENFSEVFATASKDDVRVWSLRTKQELLRIKVPNFTCSSVKFSFDGKMILTGWNDGIIRGFTPLTGKLMFAILNAHCKGCSALSVTSDGTKIISGGCEGQVRVWALEPSSQKLIKVLKEHKGPITAIDINKHNTEAVSSSSDGACIIWDLVRMCRKQILLRNTLFMSVKYYPTGVQILTSGSDRKVAYWEVFDGCLIRELEGSISESLNALDISPDGSMFLTGGNDQILKLWKYNEGYTTHVGLGHSGVISSVKFSPNGKYIVSTSGSGDIFIWNCPFDVSAKEGPESGDNNANGVKNNGSGTTVKRNLQQKKLTKVTPPEDIQNINTNPGDKEGIQVEVQQNDVGNAKN
ncbi:cilia- and flagella-associated protein 52 [Chrysoperla carnea]|uniref:cilia- and flagella-associated protein 52 n=1 Tax=Chrysoperla carnea TaxID=189513 RepID=UPI001D095D44|nr:cilia- and flagella-associated protein 52 [Chrysoperla carnea]